MMDLDDGEKTKANSSGCNKFATFPFNIQPNNLNEKFTEKTQKPPISFPSSRNNNMLYNISSTGIKISTENPDDDCEMRI